VINYGVSINKNLGSTLSMLFLYDRSYILKHIGDSRIYIINKKTIKLTEDHSWVAEQLKEGNITYKEALNHPKRNVLTRCIGTRNIELYESKGYVTENDVFLLCSDGFYNYLDEQEILKDILKCTKNKNNVQECLSNMLKKIKSKKAHDNISAIIISQNKDNNG